jgi:hypothetical protein
MQHMALAAQALQLPTRGGAIGWLAESQLAEGKRLIGAEHHATGHDSSNASRLCLR